jgi:hypothetical protein
MKQFFFFAAAMATTLCVNAETINDHEYVDLGLPSGLRWATTNVGATNPEGYGDYYAWGEIATKVSYTWENYTLANGSFTTLTKYNNNSSIYGTVDNKKTLEAADDVATQKWSGNWRMPTIDEWTELLNNCDWKWTDNYNNTGVTGDIVTSKSNGNSIFLPAAGYYDSGELNNAGSNGYYWSSSLHMNYPNCAQYVTFYSGHPDTYGNSRLYGRSVRPVVMFYGITIAATTNGSVEAAKTVAAAGETVTLTITPETGYEVEKIAVTYGEDQEVAVSADNTFTMPASAVTVTATFKATTATALQNVEMAEIYAENGTIYGAEGMQIFTITGQNVTEMNGQLNGVYIVKCADKAQKIIVR